MPDQAEHRLGVGDRVEHHQRLTVSLTAPFDDVGGEFFPADRAGQHHGIGVPEGVEICHVVGKQFDRLSVGTGERRELVERRLRGRHQNDGRSEVFDQLR